ncbi:dehydratase, partial [Enterococcus sp. HPCN18]
AVMTTDFEDEQGNLIARATMTGVETARPTVEES